jgi:uncharacterized protein
VVDTIIDRNLEPVISQRLTTVPVVIVTGARTVGKSTILAACARAHGSQVLDLDDMPTRRAVASDPSLYAQGPGEPVCIDEFQHVPAFLDAIKAELNTGPRPGRFLLTGSTRYDLLPRASQSLTGRAHIVTMWPFSQGELRGTRENFIDTLLNDAAALVTATPSSTSRASYEQMIVAGGFPIALSQPSRADRNRWFKDFITMIVQRDVMEIRRIRQRAAMPELLRHLASQSASVLNVAAIAEKMSIDARTLGDFVTLLEAVFLVHRLPAFGRTLSSRVNRSPKIHMTDTGLACYLLDLSEHRLAQRNPHVLTEFGHVVETFAVNELIKQAGWSGSAAEFSHLRTREQQEVDLVVEGDDGRIAGVEIKAGSTVTGEDFRGLRLLREQAGSDFAGGVLLNLGTRAYTFEDRLHIVPMDRLWARTP